MIVTQAFIFPPQEEAGLPGTLRSIGHKGDKGEPVMCTQLVLLG